MMGSEVLTDFERPGGPDDRLLVALLGGRTVRDAAADAGCSEATGFRRLADPVFRTRLHQARAAAFGAALVRLSDASGQACDTLAGLLHSTDDAVRLRAAEAILKAALRLRDAVEVDERLTALEAGR